MKRTVSIALVLALLAALLAGCTQPVGGTDGTTAATSPAQSTPASSGAAKSDAKTEAKTDDGKIFGEDPVKEFDIIAGQSIYHNKDFNEMLTWSGLEEMTGIRINWEYIPHENLAEKKSISLMSNDLPDAYYGCGFSSSELYKYGGDGTLIDMLPYITPEITPNYMVIHEKYESVRLGSLTPEGAMYSYPTIYDADTVELIAGPRLYMRPDWLETLGKSMPTTLDELYDVLYAFAHDDPNGNGQKDEIALACQGSIGASPLFGAFGIFNRGNRAGFDYDEDAGKVRITQMSENYKNYLIYFNKLYKDGLINTDAYTIKQQDMVAYATQTPRVMGALAGGGGPNIYGVGDEYEGTEVIQGYNGEKVNNSAYPEMISMGNFVVTYQCKAPAQIMNWYDHIYSREGATLLFLGKEGVSYYVDDEGKNQFVEDITNNPDGLTFDQAVGRYVAYPGGYYAAMIYDGLFKGSEAQPSALAAAQKIAPFNAEIRWPIWQYTLEENEVLTTTGTDLSTYITESTAKFITGEWDIAAKWDEYVAECSKIGADKVLAVRQAAHDRYYSAS